MKKSGHKKKPKPPEYPSAPGGLSPEAKKWWKKIVSQWELEDHSLLLLESLLSSFDRMREAQDLLKRDGITVTDRFNQEKPHPATVIENNAKATMLNYMKALNLSLEPLNDGPGRPPGE